MQNDLIAALKRIVETDQRSYQPLSEEQPLVFYGPCAEIALEALDKAAKTNATPEQLSQLWREEGFANWRRNRNG